jgi:hypothetical protein
MEKNTLGDISVFSFAFILLAANVIGINCFNQLHPTQLNVYPNYIQTYWVHQVSILRTNTHDEQLKKLCRFKNIIWLLFENGQAF